MRALALVLAIVGAGPAAVDIDRSRDIVCFSGGHEIFRGRSDPRAPVYLGTGGNHVIFVDRATGKHVHISGDCIVIWDAPAL